MANHRQNRRQRIIPRYRGVGDAVDSHPDLVLPWHPNMRKYGRDARYMELTLLHLLLRHDDLTLMESWWSELTRPTKKKLLPAHAAIEMGAIKCFTHIVEHHPNWLDRLDYNGFPAFVYALKAGGMFVKLLLDRKKIHVNRLYTYQECEQWLTPLHLLFLKPSNSEEFLSYLPANAAATAALLINNGSDVNAGTESHNSVIHCLGIRVFDLWSQSTTSSEPTINTYAGDRAPSQREFRTALRSSLRLLLDKGALPDRYGVMMPSMEVVAETLFGYTVDGNLDSQELSATVACLCDISDMLLSHGATKYPCYYLFDWELPKKSQLYLFALGNIQIQGEYPKPRGNGLTKYFVELQPIVQLFLNTLQHEEYYDVLERLSRLADETTKVRNTEQGDAVERWTRNAAEFSRFVRLLREKQIRPLKHITRLYIVGLLESKRGFGINPDDVAQLDLPKFLGEYLLCYKHII